MGGLEELSNVRAANGTVEMESSDILVVIGGTEISGRFSKGDVGDDGGEGVEVEIADGWSIWDEIWDLVALRVRRGVGVEGGPQWYDRIATDWG